MDNTIPRTFGWINLQPFYKVSLFFAEIIIFLQFAKKCGILVNETYKYKYLRNLLYTKFTEVCSRAKFAKFTRSTELSENDF